MKPDSKQERRRVRQQQKAQVWQAYIRAALAKRKAYDDVAKEVMSFFRAQHQEFYNSLSDRFMNFDGGVGLSIQKAAQIRAVIGPQLYQRNPARKVNALTRDTVDLGLASVLTRYLNYTPGEVRLQRSMRRAIDDALLRGRGFMEVGFDAERELITSWFQSSMNVVIDPDAATLEEAFWIAIRRREPIWKVKKWASRRATKGLEGTHVATGEIESEGDGSRVDADESDVEGTNDIVVYWDVYSKMGSGLGRGTRAPDEFKNDDDSRDFVKLSICMTHDVPLFEGSWEVPLYLDSAWPIVALDFVETLDQLWPESVMGQHLSHARAINILSSLALCQAKNHGCERFLVDMQALGGDEEYRQLLYGGPSEVIKVKELPAGRELANVVRRVDMGVMAPEIRAEREWHEAEFEKGTGATSLLHGGYEPVAKDRSATASRLRSQASSARLEDLNECVEDFAKQVARNEAIALRLSEAVDEDDVQRVIDGDEAINLGWLVAVPVGPGEELPIRVRTADIAADEDEAQEKNPERIDDETETEEPELKYGLEDLLPIAQLPDGTPFSVAEYFQTPDDAAMAAQVVAQFMAEAQAGQHELTPAQTEIVRRYTATVPLNSGTIMPRPVRVADVFRDTAGITPRDMVREYRYEIEAGTTKKLNPERKEEAINALTQNFLPLLMQNGLWGAVDWLVKQIQDGLNLPLNERLPPIEPQMMQRMQQQAMQQQAGMQPPEGLPPEGMQAGGMMR